MGETKLTEPHQKEFVKFMEFTRQNIAEAIRNELQRVLSTVYTDFAMHIDSDTWINYREALKLEMKGCWKQEVTDSKDGYWAKDVRAMILKEHRDELIHALNQDSLAEIEKLKAEISSMRRHR